MKIYWLLGFCLLLTACVKTGPVRTANGVTDVVGGCNRNQVISGITNFPIELAHPDHFPTNGCLVITGNDYIKPQSGGSLLQMNLPLGHCSRDSGWDDCSTRRSRVEFYDKRGVGSNSTVKYEYYLMIPATTELFDGSTVFLGQLNTKTNNHYSSLVMVYWTRSGLRFSTYDNFNWSISDNIYIDGNFQDQLDRWIKITYTVKVHDGDKGYLAIAVNDKQIYERKNHPTIKSGGKVQLKLGIYKSEVPEVVVPNEKPQQIVFFDNIKREVNRNLR